MYSPNDKGGVYRTSPAMWISLYSWVSLSIKLFNANKLIRKSNILQKMVIKLKNLFILTYKICLLLYISDYFLSMSRANLVAGMPLGVSKEHSGNCGNVKTEPVSEYKGVFGSINISFWIRSLITTQSDWKLCFVIYNLSQHRAVSLVIIKKCMLRIIVRLASVKRF